MNHDLIMDGGLYYDTRKYILILLEEGISGRNLHDCSIKNIYRITALISLTTLMYFNI